MSHQISNPEEYYRRGNDKLKMEDYEGAIEEYTQAITLNKKYVQAYYKRGFSLDSIGKFNEAIQDYDIAIGLNENFIQLFYNRGISKSNIGEYKGAIDDYSIAIIKSGFASADAYNNRGVSKTDLNKCVEAIEDYKKAIQLSNNKDPVPYNNLGETKHKMRQYKEAIKDYDQAIDLKNDYAYAYYNRANSKKNLKQYTDALVDYQTAHKLIPNHPLYLFGLAQFYSQKGNRQKAKEYYQLGSKQFYSKPESVLRSKYNISYLDIQYIKNCLQKYRCLTNQIDDLQKEALQLNKPEIESRLKYIQQQVLEQSIESVNLDKSKKNADEKLKLEEWMKEVKIQLQLLYYKLKKQTAKRQQLQKKVDNHEHRIVTLEKDVLEMMKRVYAVDRVLKRIENLDSRNLAQYFELFYNIVIIHFLAYCLTTAGFFEEKIRLVTTFDKCIGKFCLAEPLIKKIPQIGGLVGIPFQIVNFVRTEKNKHLNEVIANKINKSVFKTSQKISTTMAHVIGRLIQNEGFKKQLRDAITKEEKSYINKLMDFIESTKQQICSNIFQGTAFEYSYVQKVATLHITRLTIKLYKCELQDFKNASKDQEKFYRFILDSIYQPDQENERQLLTNKQKQKQKIPTSTSLEEKVKTSAKKSKPPKTSWFSSFCCSGD